MDSPSSLHSRTRPTNVRWLIFVMACGTSWLLYLHRYSWGIVRPQIQEEYELTSVQMGMLDSVFSFGYAGFQVPGGIAGDLLGPAFVLILVIVVWSLAMGSLIFGGGFWGLAGIRVVFGLSQAPTYPNLGKVSKSWFPLSIRTIMQGAVASLSGRVGGACAALIVGTLLMGVLGLSWRMALLVLVGLGLAYALLMALVFRSRPADHPWANEMEEKLIASGEPPPKANAKVRFQRQPVVLISFFFLLAHIFTSAFADQVFANWIPTFLVQAKGFSNTELGFAGLPLLGGALGGFCAGFLNDGLIRALGSRRWARTLVGASGKIIAAGLIFASLQFDDARMMMVVVAVAKFFTDWSQPTVWGAVTDIGGPATGSVFGIVNMAGSIGGFFAGPLLGWIQEQFDWTGFFMTIVGLYILSGLCWLFINTSRPLVTQE